MKLKRSTTVLALTLVLVLLAAPLTYAWLSYSLTQSVGMTAYVHKAYFESGDGSAESPFEIKTPVQLYYFAWLQNLGYFNNVNGKTGVTSSFPTYFYLSSDLDMSGFTLPPAGNTTYPFIGNFSGKDQSNVTHTISNLTIKSSATVTDLTDVPTEGNNMAATDPQILGFFGVIGDYNGAGTYSFYSPSVHDLTLCDIVIQSISPDDDKTLCGIVAGYSNGAMSNVSVTRSGAGDIITINTGLSALGSPLTTNYSDYGVVGYCTPAYLATVSNSEATVYEPLLITDYTGGEGYGGSASGPGDHWGGSINMKEMNERFYRLINRPEATVIDLKNGNTVLGTKYFKCYTDNYESIAFYRSGADTYFSTSPLTNQVFYVLSGGGSVSYIKSKKTYVPDNDLPETYIPLLANYEDGIYKTDIKNTGYITSKNISSTTGNNSGTVRFASYPIRFISNSLSNANNTNAQVDSGSGGTYPAYDKAETEILTNGSASWSSNNFVLIKDEMEGYNQNHVVSASSAMAAFRNTKTDSTTPTALGLEKYNASRASLDEILGTLIHGIHFMDSAVTTSNPVTIPSAIFNDDPVEANRIKTNFKVPASCIDFYLREEGKINFFAGSYYSRSGNSYADSFFSLYKISRNGTELTAVNRIDYIYLNNNYDPNTPDSEKYVYRYQGQNAPANAGELVFDMRFIMNEPPVKNALYYFEIPVNKGEYALGTVSGTSGGAYLIYLDIGVSAAKVNPIEGTKTVEYLTTTTSNYTYPSGVSLQLTSGQVDDPITTANSSTNISTIRTPTYGYTEWKWQKEVFVGTINGVDSTVKIAKITRTDYNSAGTQTAQSEESYQWDSTANSGSGGWAAYTTDVEFLDLSAVTSYLTEAAKYTYSGAPNGTASAPYSASIFESDTSSVTWSTTPATGKLYTMASGTYSVTLPTSASLHKLFGANASNTGSIVLITKTE